MNILLVSVVFVGCVAHVLSTEQSYNEVIVCGGELREHPSSNGRSITNRRSLRVITRSFHSAKEISDLMLFYYVSHMNVLEYDITLADTLCAGALVPEVLTNVANEDVTTELSRDYQKLIEVLSALDFVQSHTNDVYQASELDRLETVVYDILCSINNLGLEAGISLSRRIHVSDISMPVEVFTSGSTVTCDSRSVYQRTKVDHEILRLAKSYFDHLYNKYSEFNRRH